MDHGLQSERVWLMSTSGGDKCKEDVLLANVTLFLGFKEALLRENG